MFTVYSDMWCGVVSTCAIRQGDDVTIGCYAQYDWNLQTKEFTPEPIVSTLQFFKKMKTNEDKPNKLTHKSETPNELLKIYHTIENVQPGSDITATCVIDFKFKKGTMTHVYSTESLQRNCSITSRVDCEYRFDFCCAEKAWYG